MGFLYFILIKQNIIVGIKVASIPIYNKNKKIKLSKSQCSKKFIIISLLENFKCCNITNKIKIIKHNIDIIFIIKDIIGKIKQSFLL